MSNLVEAIAKLDFDKSNGLVTAVAQDIDTGAVLMVGYMNREAVTATIERRRAVFFSRSKQRLWEKGESSGNTLTIVDIAVDCDDDCILLLVRPRGPTCHLGTATCFGSEPRTSAQRLAFLATLEQVQAQRISERPDGSYTAKLFAQGPKRIAQKVGEEGVEVALAGVSGEDSALIGEAADLLFHLSLLMKARGLSLEDVVKELESRHRESR
jgi:phosphoribosyl-ATP pyrophosphohydrolase/phosphoribosyl-AMP cyclohydrolase